MRSKLPWLLLSSMGLRAPKTNLTPKMSLEELKRSASSVFETKVIFLGAPAQ